MARKPKRFTRKLEGIWRQFARSLTPTREVAEDGTTHFRSKMDPPLADQISAQVETGLDGAQKMALYMEAVRTAPNASPSTKRKWMRRLQVDSLV